MRQVLEAGGANGGEYGEMMEVYTAILEASERARERGSILGAKLPDDAGVDSISILPVLRGGEAKEPTHPFVIHHSVSGRFAIRKGDWKFIAAKGSGGWSKGGDGGECFHKLPTGGGGGEDCVHWMVRGWGCWGWLSYSVGDVSVLACITLPSIPSHYSRYAASISENARKCCWDAASKQYSSRNQFHPPSGRQNCHFSRYPSSDGFCF